MQIPLVIQSGAGLRPVRLSQRLTELEIGIVGADVVASTKQPLHHQCRAHGIEQTEVFGNPTFLGGGKEGRVRREGKGPEEGIL